MRAKALEKEKEIWSVSQLSSVLGQLGCPLFALVRYFAEEFVDNLAAFVDIVVVVAEVEID